MMPTPPSRLLAYACLATSMSLVGCYVALSRPLAAVFPVFLLAWLRFGIGAVAMVKWLQKPGAELPLSGRTKWLLFLESFFGNFLFTLCMVAGVAMTNAVTASVTMAAMPAVVAGMGWLFLKEKLGLRMLAAIGCGVLGIALLALSEQQAVAPHEGTFYSSHTLGQILLIGALLCESAYSIIGKQLTTHLSAKRISSLINLWGLLLATPLGLYAAWSFPFSQVSIQIWLLLVFYALAACMWTVGLWMTGLKTIPASQAGIFTVFLPVSSALTGVVVLGEHLNSVQLVALGIALVGVLLATLPDRN